MAADNPDRRLWWLTVYDPTTGCATRVVGVVGVDHTGRYVSWMPHDPGVASWWGRIHWLTDLTAAAVDGSTTVNGISIGMVAIEPPPPAVDLAGAVEAALDHALTAASATRTP